MLIYNIRLIDNINLVQENIVLDVIVRGNNNFKYILFKDLRKAIHKKQENIKKLEYIYIIYENRLIKDDNFEIYLNVINYMSSVMCIVDKRIYEKDNWNRKRSVVLYRVNKSNKIRGW
jgi:hypothetical protein